MSVVSVSRPSLVLRWKAFEAWIGTRRSAAALFVLALAVFGLQSLVLPVHSGRDMSRYVQAFLQLFYEEPVLPSVMNTRGPFASLGVGVPLELGGAAAEIWLGLLYASSIVAWGVVAVKFGARAALLTTGLLLLYPGYGILFHGLASDALFAAGFAGWAVVLTRAMLRPSVVSFLLAGAGMGLLVLVRPANQVLIVVALLPLLVRAPVGRRLSWMAAFFIASAAVTQGWKALADLRYSEAVALTPSTAVLVTALVLLPLLLPAAWRWRLAVLAIPLAVGVVAVKGLSVQSPTHYVRTLAQVPSTDVFLFRAFMMNRIVSPDNGPESEELGRLVQQELLAHEPYSSYGISLDEFFSSGSDRIFGDLTSLAGSADLQAVTHEAIRQHPGTFAKGIVRTIWEQFGVRRVYAPESITPADAESPGDDETGFVVVNGRRLPRPSEGQPIPASRVGPGIRTLKGSVQEVWRSPTAHPLVFSDPRDERRYARFEHDTSRLVDRVPTRSANEGLLHHLNRASKAFPPPVFWLAVGLLGLALRRPNGSLVALAPTIAGVVVIVATALVAPAVAEYAAPVSPAFVMLAVVGLVGAEPRGSLRSPLRRRTNRTVSR